ncbi:bifunctional 2-C-methyl-D-erythritol 4-phosphate cytidylyltransferase/2-C-methyl-D-erythritol 2,4-cyclodiphosphate synthase [Breoghania sp.]|uniref:bifunctional 2-C-methyl-D-erythritol 4-phosphate cytidylyltransferase/2-C-methyl-D-erythritol 2,4-cyclodiphosphate synthase n=1 Tax=Breoghania sp. TaxID=2065378 RepID=UPI002AAB77A6|nr:bifunctional 2-C-methyl-D-erythritol 4-phosphate cytidylyltransferase/2-C-methyl-D-erythritol 2,4-cyclodiphosphate synthase [Breoghania sp.]
MGDTSGTAPKQYRELAGQAILVKSIESLAASSRINALQAVIHADDRESYETAVSSIGLGDRLRAPVIGGATRQASVLAGLEALSDAAPDYVLIHDGVRPFVTVATVDKVIDALLGGCDAALAATQIVDTLKRTDQAAHIVETVSREDLWAAQTPQGFRFAPLIAAHRKAVADGENTFTDDAAVAEWAGIDVCVVEGDKGNMKITTAEDLEEARTRARQAEWMALADIRTGTGYDVHAFAPGDHVTLGGIDIPHDRRLSGHSDADVALHAITDAIFGALADGDIGSHFPPSDPQWKGAASHIFLRKAVARVAERGGAIAHLDVTIVCEAPKIGPHRDAMRKSIAEICGLSLDRVAVKATTSERLGFTGRGEGIASLATATIRLPLRDET